MEKFSSGPVSLSPCVDLGGVLFWESLSSRGFVSWFSLQARIDHAICNMSRLVPRRHSPKNLDITRAMWDITTAVAGAAAQKYGIHGTLKNWNFSNIDEYQKPREPLHALDVLFKEKKNHVLTRR